MMETSIKWPVIMACPGEDELSLLAELSARRDAEIVAIADPGRKSMATNLAEVMGIPIIDNLDELTAGSANYLIHPALNEEVAPLVDGAEAHGLEAVLARDFAGMMAERMLADPVTRRPQQKQTVDFDFLEMETASIHRTLSRIEEALDRDALLRWLMGLAIRATEAGSGSIMLFDDVAGELYVAHADGLSQKTLHGTRVRLGEGISGRVAASRMAELISDNRHPGAERDRSAIKAAVCAPIVWEGRLLGVLNVSSADGQHPLAANALDITNSLTHRFGMILDRFLRLQMVHDSELFREMERAFTAQRPDPTELGETLCGWATDLARLAGAAKLTLGVLNVDGDLFLGGTEGISLEAPTSARKSQVLGSGKPLIERPDPGPGDDPAAEVTVFHLAVGREPARALLSVEFSSAASSHHFRSVSAEVLYLVNRHLGDLLDRAATEDQLERLTTLAAALSDLATVPADTLAARRARILSAACRLTGADQAYVLEEGDVQAGVDPANEEAVLRHEAARLLGDTGARGWQSTVIVGQDPKPTGKSNRSLLVVPLEPGEPFPGLVLLDKRRLHALDGAAFTEFDALFARRLLPLLSSPVLNGTAPQSTLASEDVEDLTSALVEAPAEGAGPDAEFLVVSEHESDGRTRESLSAILRRELDRCDRYHTMLGVVAVRVLPTSGTAPDVEDMLRELARKLRTSDHAGALDDGTILILVPEDIQSLPRLQKRVKEILRTHTCQPDLIVRSGCRVYPGGGDTPEQLVSSALASLS